MFPRCDPTKNINVSWANPHFVLPSGKHTKNYGTSPFYSWVNRVKPLFRLGHFSIAFCMFTRPGKPPFSHGFPMVFPSYKPPFSIYKWPVFGFWRSRDIHPHFIHFSKSPWALMAPRQGKSRSAPRDVKCCTRSGANRVTDGFRCWNRGDFAWENGGLRDGKMEFTKVYWRFFMDGNFMAPKTGFSWDALVNHI